VQYSNQPFFKAETLYGRFSTLTRAPSSLCEEKWGVWTTEGMQQVWGKGNREHAEKNNLVKKRG